MSLGLGIDLAIIGAGGFAVPFEFVNSLYSDGDRSFAEMSSAVTNTGYFGNALEFDGVDDYVNFTEQTYVTTVFSASFWIKYTTVNSNRIIFGSDSDSNKYFRLDSATQFSVRTRSAGGSIDTWTVPTLSSGQWYHVAISLDNGTNLLWLNGTQYSSNSSVNYSSETISVGRIGGRSDGTQMTEGAIDDFIIQSVVLNQTDVDSIYNSGAGSLPTTAFPNSDVYYKFNESSGTSAADSSGNNNTGTLNNFTGTYFVPHIIYTPGLALSFWVYFDGSISNEYIFGHVGDADMFFRFDSSTSATFQTSIGTSTTWTISANSTGWNHVAMSLNGGVNELWINSVKSTGTTEDYDAEDINISLIGRSDTSYGLFVMDELIIDVGGTLTQAQVNSLYKGGKGVLSNTVITTPDIFYRFDQTSGTTVVDSSGNGNNATLYFPTNGDWSPHELEAPTITSGSVNTTSPAQVVLTGTNFYSVTSLSASGTAVVESYTIDSVTQITATVNVETAGDYSITVNNIVGSDTISSQTIALYDFGNYIQPDLGNTTERGIVTTPYFWNTTNRFSNMVVAYWAKRPIAADTSKTNVVLSGNNNNRTYIFHRNTSPYIRFASDGDNNSRQVEWNLNITDNDWHHFYYFYNNNSLTEDITQQPTGAADGTYTSVSTSAYPPGGTGLTVRAVVSGGFGNIDRLEVSTTGSGYRVGDEITFTVDGQEAKAVLSKVPDTVDGELYLVYDGVLQTRSSAAYQFDGLDNFGTFFVRGSTSTFFSEIGMDDIVFDERVSTLAEAQAIYNNARGGNVTNIFGSQPLYWYKFNEANGATTIAQSGSAPSADMTLTNFTNAYLLPKSGYNFGNALQYDGVNDYCSLPANLQIAAFSTEFTLSLWMNPLYNSESGQFWVFENSTSADMWFFYPSATYFRLNGNTNQNVWTYGYDTAGDTGSWHHYVLTRDSSNVIEMYVDGVKQTKSTSNANSANLQMISVGNRFNNTKHFKGEMDEFIIKSGYAATPADVVSLYNDGLGIDSSLALPSPLAYWKFNETTGTTASDSSGNGNDLTLNNFTGTPWVPH